MSNANASKEISFLFTRAMFFRTVSASLTRPLTSNQRADSGRKLSWSETYAQLLCLSIRCVFFLLLVLHLADKHLMFLVIHWYQ